jgi:MoaA/NifB/PqqE/SkfB family radical SAM enzyme
MSAPRVASVVTNLRCNQACVWCTRRSGRDDPAFVRGAAVRGRIEAGIAAGSRELVLTGGEPTMRADLEEIVAYASSRGMRVMLETNATLVDVARARRLREAGLDSARVGVAGLGTEADARTRDPGGAERALAGMRAFAEAGVRLEVAWTLVRSTSPDAAQLPARLSRALPGIVTAIVVVFPVDTASGDEALRFDEAARDVLALERAARAEGIAVRMSTGDTLPPCAFVPRERARLTHLYAMTPGAERRSSHTHVAACGECILKDRCSGVADATLARFGEPPMHPVADDRTRRRLAVASSVPDQIERELVTRCVRATPAGLDEDAIVRVVFRCNQACTFCFVSTHLPAAPRGAVEAAIRDAAARGARVVLSGGEPTLDPRIVGWVALAKSLGRREVCLQTNAVLLDDASLAARLEAAGLDEAFVSLHGATAETSDAVTEAPGTYARTAAGIDNLCATAIRVTLNFVVCERNRRELPDFVRLVARRWPRASVNVSFVAPSTDVVPRDRALVPRYTDALPAIAEALVEARRLGVPAHGFESMCGLPLCLVPPEAGDLALAPLPPGYDDGEFLKTDACAACSRERECWGLRRGYAELHGSGELRPM